MTNEERIQRIEDTINARDKQTNGEFSNVIAMVHSIIYDESDIPKYLQEQVQENEDIVDYIEQLERFLDIK